MTTYDDVVESVAWEWAPDRGFFWRLRQGQFVASEFERVLVKLRGLTIPADDDRLPRRLVSTLWYIPVFMHWQTERVVESGGDAHSYGMAVAAMTNEVERLLGVP